MKQLITDFQQAVKRLEEVLALPFSEINRDSAIKRCEFCFELAWKVMKDEAKKHGMEGYSPRDYIKNAYQLKLIDYDTNWLGMIDDRNYIVHMYGQVYADKVYSHLPKHLQLFQSLSDRLSRAA